ncbi:MAG: DMT family transporter [Verrucomicrobia bacterium]|nr:DMT family transporter [Verrucomicrobiota bacterium]
MFSAKTNGGILAGLLLCVFIWGGNNTAIRFCVREWGPMFLASSRFLIAGAVMLALLRWTDILGKSSTLSEKLRRDLWVRGALSLATYVVAFNYAMVFTTASNTALYIAASPVWALVWEGRPRASWRSAQRYGAALLALCGALVLFWPALNFNSNRWLGDALALASSVLWANYGRQCRRFGEHLSGAEMTAQAMWRAGLLMAPFAVVELALKGFHWRWDFALAHGYTIFGGVVVAFALCSNALRHWPTSKVYLFMNLIPLSTVLWAHTTLDEPISKNFWPAMLLVVAGVLLGQANWQRLLGNRFQPTE